MAQRQIACQQDTEVSRAVGKDLINVIYHLYREFGVLSDKTDSLALSVDMP